MVARNAVRAALAWTKRDPHESDRARRRDRIRTSTFPNITATDAAHHDRAWWLLEARRVGSDWPAALALHAAVIAAWRRRRGYGDTQ
jgi:hypothetical protein